MNKPVVLFTAIMAVTAGVAGANALYIVEIHYDRGELSSGNITVTNSYMPTIVNTTGQEYTARLITDDGTVLYERPFSIDSTVYGHFDGSSQVAETSLSLRLPYKPAATTLVILHKGTIELAIDITGYTRPDDATAEPDQKTADNGRFKGWGLVLGIGVLLAAAGTAAYRYVT